MNAVEHTVDIDKHLTNIGVTKLNFACRYVQPAQPGKWPGSLPEALLPGAHPDKLRVYKDFQTVWQRLHFGGHSSCF